jgi:hypothetical protein
LKCSLVTTSAKMTSSGMKMFIAGPEVLRRSPHSVRSDFRNHFPNLIFPL